LFVFSFFSKAAESWKNKQKSESDHQMLREDEVLRGPKRPESWKLDPRLAVQATLSHSQQQKGKIRCFTSRENLAISAIITGRSQTHNAICAAQRSSSLQTGTRR